jgi:hypothetical protein
MSQLKLDQILAPLRFTGSRLIVTGSDFLVSGSDVFGNNISQSHDFTGSVRITGSLWINNSPVIASSQTSSMTVLSSSFAATASFVQNAIYSASVSLNTITFTKGDGTTFPITVNTGSGGGGGTGAGFPYSGSAIITGSLEVTQGITGSLFGTSSWSQNALTASYAISIMDQGFVYTQSSPSTTWTINHNLNTQIPHVDVYGSDYYAVIPQEVVATTLNTITITFPNALSGYAIVSKGSGTAISASFATSASFAANTPFYKIGVSGSTMYTITHSLNEEYPIVQIYDAVDREQIIPIQIQSINTNQVFINIGFLFSGSIVVKK